MMINKTRNSRIFTRQSSLPLEMPSWFGNRCLDVEDWVAVGHRVAVDVPKAINLYLQNDDISSKAEIKSAIIQTVTVSCFKFRLFKMNLH